MQFFFTGSTQASAQTRRGTSIGLCSMTSMLSTGSCMRKFRPWPRSLRKWTKWCITFLQGPPVKWYNLTIHTDTHAEKQCNAQIITQLTNMLLLFQEKERIDSILMEYQRKKAVSTLHIIFPPLLSLTLQSVRVSILWLLWCPCATKKEIRWKFVVVFNSNYAKVSFFLCFSPM